MAFTPQKDDFEAAKAILLHANLYPFVFQFVIGVLPTDGFMCSNRC